MKKLIGVVPKGMLFDMEASSMTDKYELGNNYTRRVSEAGCIPVGLAPVDGWISEDILDSLDAFIVQGGTRIWPYHFQVIHHAVKRGKRCLGICLGMQLIHCYFSLREAAEETEPGGDPVRRMYERFVEENAEYRLLERVDGHYSSPLVRGREDEVKHDLQIVPGTLLHRLVNGRSIRGATYHRWRVHDPVECLTVNARAEDGTIEGIEYGGYILGVQFHPEVDALLPELFDFLAGSR